MGLGLCIPALAAGVYASLGTPGLPGRPFAEIERPVEEPEAVAAFREPVERLAARLQSDPDNLEGWLLLGRSYVVLQRYREAADALRQAAALSGGDPEVLGMLGEAIVWANDGVVVPEAVSIFRQALETQPDDPASRFHLALASAQAGEVQQAYEMWLALAADAPADAPWQGDLEGLIRQAAAVLGVEPGAVPRGPPAAPRAPDLAEAPSGPTADDVAAAAEMTPDERMEMIRTMVEGLAARLEENPDDAQGWRRLARSYAVLGEPGKALDTLRRAVELAPDNLETLHAYARALTGDLGVESHRRLRRSQSMNESWRSIPTTGRRSGSWGSRRRSAAMRPQRAPIGSASCLCSHRARKNTRRSEPRSIPFREACPDRPERRFRGARPCRPNRPPRKP